MQGITILLAFVLVAFAKGTNSPKHPYWQLSWIMGGTDAAPGEFPYMVSLRDVHRNNEHYCGGSIISNRYILTAAHCIVGRSSSSVRVVAGTHKLNLPGQTYDASALFPHHLYNSHKNDIGLVKVRRSIVYSSIVQPAPLASRGERVAVGTRCTFMGWGYTSPSATSFPNNLQKLQLNIISNNECRKTYAYVTDKHICATAGPEKGTCYGDSGGPLICRGKQVGVYIGGGGPGSNCSTPYPSIFMNVPRYIDWFHILMSLN